MKKECFTCDAQKQEIKNSCKYNCIRINKIIQLNDTACKKYEVSAMMSDIRKEMSIYARKELDKIKRGE